MINIVLDCKNNSAITAIVYQVIDMLRRDLCEKNGFSFICNDIITINYLWKDGVHLQDMKTYFKQSF